MKTTFLTMIVCIFMIHSCTQESRFVAEGTVKGPEFEGSKIYFVALDGPVSRDVDSTIIKNGKFRFERKADPMEIRILRVPARLPSIIEDLVLVTEEGKVGVSLSDRSYGSGTPLNNALQVWKEFKHDHDSTQAELYSAKNVASSQALADSLMACSGILAKRYYDSTREIMNENLQNGIGLLIFKVYYHSFTAVEKKHVLEVTGDLYAQYDEQLKMMLSNDESLKN